jgi:hypothetical protein
VWAFRVDFNHRAGPITEDFEIPKKAYFNRAHTSSGHGMAGKRI